MRKAVSKGAGSKEPPGPAQTAGCRCGGKGEGDLWGLRDPQTFLLVPPWAGNHVGWVKGA